MKRACEVDTPSSEESESEFMDDATFQRAAARFCAQHPEEGEEEDDDEEGEEDDEEGEEDDEENSELFNYIPKHQYVSD